METCDFPLIFGVRRWGGWRNRTLFLVGGTGSTVTSTSYGIVVSSFTGTRGVLTDDDGTVLGGCTTVVFGDVVGGSHVGSSFVGVLLNDGMTRSDRVGVDE